MDIKSRLQKIKTGLKSSNQDDWATFDDIDWLIKQTEKLTKIEDTVEHLNHIANINYPSDDVLDDSYDYSEGIYKAIFEISDALKS